MTITLGLYVYKANDYMADTESMRQELLCCVMFISPVPNPEVEAMGRAMMAIY